MAFISFVFAQLIECLNNINNKVRGSVGPTDGRSRIQCIWRIICGHGMIAVRNINRTQKHDEFMSESKMSHENNEFVFVLLSVFVKMHISK